jgi:hypothetical protein
MLDSAECMYCKKVAQPKQPEYATTYVASKIKRTPLSSNSL